MHSVKRSHEEWVRKTLATSDGLSPLTILRAKPTALQYLGTAKELLDVAASAEESSLDYEPIETEDELDLVAGFLQLVHDHAEMWDDCEPASRIRATFELDREIRRSGSRAGSSSADELAESCEAAHHEATLTGTPRTSGSCERAAPILSGSTSLQTPTNTARRVCDRKSDSGRARS